MLLPIRVNTKSPTNKKSRIVLTCYGYTPCNACKSCNYCKYCTSGGMCGICASAKSKQPITFSSKSKQTSQPSQPMSSNQCKAITKAGTRCKRPAKANGYCWQHRE